MSAIFARPPSPVVQNIISNNHDFNQFMSENFSENMNIMSDTLYEDDPFSENLEFPPSRIMIEKSEESGEKYSSAVSSESLALPSTSPSTQAVPSSHSTSTHSTSTQAASLPSTQAATQSHSTQSHSLPSIPSHSLHSRPTKVPVLTQAEEYEIWRKVQTEKEILQDDETWIANLDESSREIFKTKIMEAHVEMTKNYPAFAPKEFSGSESLEQLHAKYKTAYDEIQILEDVTEYKIVITIVIIVLEAICKKYVSFISVEGFFNFFKTYKEEVDSCVKSFCTDSYNWVKSETKRPSQISFVHDGELLSFEMENSEVKIPKPSMSEFLYNLFGRLVVQFINFMILKFASNFFPEVYAKSIVDWISSFTKSKEVQIGGGLEYFIPIARKRNTTNIYGQDVLTIIENYSSAAINFILFNAIGEDKKVEVKRPRTPRAV